MLSKEEIPLLNCIEIIVENGAFAGHEQMLHFEQCFH